MITKPSITIGIPVYNVESYIRRCLDSALNQDINLDYEIIIVDDCGTDNSIDIVQTVKVTHPKGYIIHIIKHEDNKGLAEARNTVIKNAKGKYIYFMDSDDYIAPYTLSLLYETAEKYQTDVVYGSNFKQEGDKVWTEEEDIFPYKLFLKEGDFTSYIYMTPHALVPITVWNILFNTSFIRDNVLLFPNIRYQEDIAFNELYFPLVKKAAFLSNQTYYYIIRKDSLMNKTYRSSIDIEEAYRAFKLCEEIKGTCNRWKNQPFHSGKCATVMRKCFYNMGGLIKHESLFTSPLPLKSVREAMKHPESLGTILHFKKYRIENLFYYLLGILPPLISTQLLLFISKKKGLI
jgi:glycosyltransferase involved in cell wall biosynthesis